MSSHDTVPYFVLPLKDGRTKAVFTVPEDSVPFLTAHPILCRGSTFDLQIDAISQRANSGGQSKTSFLSTEFYSPEPESTASDISKRIAVRMENSAERSGSPLDAGAMLLS